MKDFILDIVPTIFILFIICAGYLYGYHIGYSGQVDHAVDLSQQLRRAEDLIQQRTDIIEDLRRQLKGENSRVK